MLSYTRNVAKTSSVIAYVLIVLGESYTHFNPQTKHPKATVYLRIGCDKKNLFIEK